MTPTEKSTAHVERGFIFSLLPEEARSLYQECIQAVCHELNVKIECNLDASAGDVAEEVWGNIQKAEVIVADISDYQPQVMCEVGISLGIKDPKKIVLLRNDRKIDQEDGLPIDLRKLKVVSYDTDDLSRFKQDLYDRLRESISAGPPPHPLPDLNDRQVVEKAMFAAKAKDWVVAEILFNQMDTKLPNNWYILNQMGIMYREKGDYDEAYKRFQQAEKAAGFDQYKAAIYIEQALLEQQQKNTSRAEGLFESARRADKKNRQLYIAWADLYYQLGQPERALGQITELMKELGRADEEAQILMNFYSEKVTDPGFSMSLEEFKKRWHFQSIKTPPDRGPKPVQPQTRSVPSHPRGSTRVPDGISWQEFQRTYPGAVVDGEVKNTHPALGVFVHLNNNLKGLIFKPNAGFNFEQVYRPGDRIRVRIQAVFLDPLTNTQKIQLLPVPAY